MARLDNVLYVFTMGSYLAKDHDSIVVSVNKERKLQVPIVQLEGVVVGTGAGISPDLLGALMDASVYVSFFTSGGKFQGRCEGMPGGGIVLRRAHHAAACDPQKKLRLAQAFVIGKVASQRRQLRRAARESDGELQTDLDHSANHLAAMSRRATQVDSVAEARGVEGAAASEYFGVFGKLIKPNDAGFAFTTRSRRPPKDPVNALLSFGYALLMRDCAAALAGTGLDPALGFLHEDRPGRLGLALDLMEELRVPVVDRLVLSLLNRNQLKMESFSAREDGGWEMTDDTRREFVSSYQRAKQQTIQHVFLGQEAIWGMVPHLQARLLARTIRGELDDYPPFEVR
jgi:CRISP-associated protein Cas1